MAINRGLAFFASISNNKTSNKDPLTGNTISSTNIELNVEKVDPKDSFKITSVESKTATYQTVDSILNEDQFINYQGNSSLNNYVPFVNNSDFAEDLSLRSIIDWSTSTNTNQSMRLNAYHFAFLKNFNTYPANRLMVLRRFPNGVQDDLFTTKMKALNTMVTYYDVDKIPLDISFNEEWTKFNDPFMSVLEDVIGIKLDDVPLVGNILSKVAGSPLSQDLFQKIGQKLGITTQGENIYGDPNVIYESSIRKVSRENVESGLSSNINIDFEVTYIQNEINGIDANSAMMQIIAEAIHMGTSNARFYISAGGEQFLNEFTKNLREGNAEATFNTVMEAIKNVLNESKELLTKATSGIVDAAKSGDISGVVDKITTGAINLVGDIFKNRYQRYKWKLIGAISALTGSETAPWHVTLGNPKNPWFMCGNLVLKSASIEFEGEMGYNDMPNEVTIKYKLESGRSMGASEIASLFNKGKGRIYTDKIKIQNISIQNDKDVTLPGQQLQSSSGNTGITEINNKEQVDTNQTNNLRNSGIPSSDFSLNVIDIDNNLPKSTNNIPTFGN